MIPASLLLDAEAVDDCNAALISYERWRRSRSRKKSPDPPRCQTAAGAVLFDAIQTVAPNLRIDTIDDKHTARSRAWADFDSERRRNPWARSNIEARKYSRLYMMLRDHLPELPKAEAQAVIAAAHAPLKAAREAEDREAEIRWLRMDSAWRESLTRQREQASRITSPTVGDWHRR